MTTVAQRLASPGMNLAFVLVLEGTGIAYTDDADISGLSTATGLTVKHGLHVKGAVTRSLELLRHQINPVPLQVEIADIDKTLVTLMATDLTTAFVTYLTANLDRDDTTITVKSTAAFPASGTIHIGHERITYASKNATQFLTCVRGTLPAWKGKATWAHTHRAIVGSLGDGVGAEVSSSIREWKGRAATLYIASHEPSTGAWIAMDYWHCEFAGFIEDWSCSGKTWTYDLVSFEELTSTEILRDQFTATLQRGFFVGDPANPSFGVALTFIETVWQNSPTANTSTGVSLTVPGGQYTIEELIDVINGLLIASALVFDWSFSIDGTTQRVKLTVVTVEVIGATQRVACSVEGDLATLTMLGWHNNGAADSVSYLSTPTVVTSTGADRPVDTVWKPNATTQTVEDIKGVWVTQPSDELPAAYPSGQGYLQFGESQDLWLASVSGSTITRVVLWTFSGHAVGPVNSDAEELIYLGDPERLPVRQVWITHPISAGGTAAAVLLRMLTSTGTTDYNYETTSYDKWPYSMGLGIPSTLINIPSFLAIVSQVGMAARQGYVITEPRAAKDEIESIMASLGFHLGWRNGKLEAVFLSTPTAMASDWTLNSDNTGSNHYTDTASGAGAICNKLILKYNRNPVTDEYEAQDTYDNLPSQLVHGAQPFEWEARFLQDSDGSKLAAWRQNVAAPAVAFFGRPLRRFTRSGNRTLVGLCVGDVVTVDDDDAPSATAGTYGYTGVKAWVTDLTFNYETLEFDQIKLLTVAGRTFIWGPSGMLDYDRADKGYDGVLVYLRPHEFSDASEVQDVARFKLGDAIRIVEVDPPNGASPITWLRVLEDTEPADELVLTPAGGLSAPAFDTTKRYYVELDDHVTAIAALPAVRSHDTGTIPVAVIGDDADDLIQDAHPTALWSSGGTAITAATPDPTFMFRRLPDVADDDGEPVSVHKLRDLAAMLNNLHAHGTNQHPIDSPLQANRTITNATYGLLIGPFKVPCPPGAVSLLITIYGAALDADGCYFRATSTPGMPTGTVAAPVFGPEKAQAESAKITATALAAISLTLPMVTGPDGVTYVTIEGKGFGVNDQAILRGVSASFAARAVA